ncbi:MAG: TatD family hydrolase [Candidatus Nanohalobium sp.]
MKAVDSHCHIDFEQYNKDRARVIEKCREELEFIVNAGSCPENNRKTVKLAEKHPDFIIPNLGLHPTYTDHFKYIGKVKEQIRNRKAAAVGEIGLDYHHVKEKDVREEQRKVFRQMLSLAEDEGLPAVLHTRDAEKDSLEILEEFSLPGIFLHCFNGRPELAEKAVEKDMKVGVTTQVLYSDRVQEIVKALDLGDLMLETDSPFLYRGERNSPANVWESAEKIAVLKDVSVEEVVDVTAENSRCFFQADEWLSP